MTSEEYDVIHTPGVTWFILPADLYDEVVGTLEELGLPLKEST